MQIIMDATQKWFKWVVRFLLLLLLLFWLLFAIVILFNLTQIRVLWEKETSLEKMALSDCPVSKSHVGPGLYKKVNFSSHKKKKIRDFPGICFCFTSVLSPGSCLGFIRWWSVTCKSDKPFLLLSCFYWGFYHLTEKQARTILNLNCEGLFIYFLFTL
jgi:hypothetical protein